MCQESSDEATNYNNSHTFTEFLAINKRAVEKKRQWPWATPWDSNHNSWAQPAQLLKVG